MLAPVTQYSEAANDSRIMPMGFQEILPLVRIDPGCEFLVVPEKTYGPHGGGQMINSSRIRGNPPIKTGENPVIMRGAWEIWTSKWATHSGLLGAVLDRYMRRYKLSTITGKDAEKIANNVMPLIYHSGKSKRWRYTAARFDIYRHLRIGLGDEQWMCWVDGNWLCINLDQISIIKSLMRHRKKLSNLQQQLDKVLGEH